MLAYVAFALVLVGASAQEIECQCGIFGTGTFLTSPLLRQLSSTFMTTCSRSACESACASTGRAYDNGKFLSKIVLDRECKRKTLGESMCNILELDEKDLTPWRPRTFARAPKCGYRWTESGHKFSTKLCCTRSGSWDPNNTRDCPGYA